MPDPPPLLEADVDPDPLVQFGRWFDEAGRAVPHPEQVAVATATAAGAPSVRMVLMKSFDARGFVFHSNYASRKGAELAENPRAALLFHWDPLGRQVRLEGPVERVGAEESDRYFATRPLGGQLAAHASAQSEPVAGRHELEATMAALRQRYGDGPVPRPPGWGGYRLRPLVYEFWQNGEDRLHDRLRYTHDGDGWRIDRLQP